MKKFKKGLMFLVLVLTIMFVAACSEETSNDSDENSDVEGEKVTIRYAHFQPGDVSQPKHAAALAFKSYVEDNSNGTIEVEIYPASQLGDEATTLEGLQLGSIQMTVIHDGPISSIYEPMSVFNMPYLFNVV